MAKLRHVRALQKAHGSVQSLVPILYARFDNIQVAVDQATEFLIESVRRFEEDAHQLLLSSGSSTLDSNTQLRNFVEGCRLYCSGNLMWR